MNKIICIFSIVLVFATIACSSNNEPWNDNSVTIDVQPFVGFPNHLTQQVAGQLKKICPNINIKEEINFPSSSLYLRNRRYRADTIINFFKRSTSPGHITLGLTNFDISTTKGKIEDWGVMGLGLKPGNACVASTYRLKAETLDSQFYKVCIHELGHTAGLDHCPEKTCFMRDAEGGNPLDEEVDFCKRCKNFLKTKGWQL